MKTLSKKLVAVYGINEDGSVVKLNFDINDQNELVFQSKGLGKFIISYESDIKDKDDKDDPKKEENTKPESSKEEDTGFTDQLMNFLPWAAIIAVVAIGGGFFFIKWKNGARED